jgi:disulfide oxidoreductase YuzD
MTNFISVKIIASPVACKDGIKESWREVAKWVAKQLNARYGERVRLQYFDLFDPDCPAIPAQSQLPVVMIADEMISNGGKISIPLIRKVIDEMDS